MLNTWPSEIVSMINILAFQVLTELQLKFHLFIYALMELDATTRAPRLPHITQEGFKGFYFLIIDYINI